MKPFQLGSRVTIDDLIDVGAKMRPVALPPPARARINAANAAMKKATASGDAIYGVNTGFGELASRRISQKDIQTLQYNFLRSHAAGAGEPLRPAQSRAILFLRANEFAKGHSGCRLELAQMLVNFLNRGLAPVVPSRGSVGASGDLAPQAHAALPLIGEGHVQIWEKNRWSRPMAAAQGLKRAGLKPVDLQAKEGLTLSNGTQAMQSVGGVALFQARRVLNAANAAGAMSLEAIKGTPVPFEEALVNLKPHPGQLWAARQLRDHMRGSEIRKSHVSGDTRVQDPYSLRCMPQVHGAVKDALDYAFNVTGIEMNSVTDNPVVVGPRVISGGNFHGQPIAFAFDFAAIALTALGNIADRRMAQLISGAHPLPPFLTQNPGLESGFMIPQYTTAALTAENKILAHPASADSIPTCAGKEDFVSMGMTSALKLTQIVQHTARIIAIELLAAAHAVELHRPLKPGRGVAEALARLRKEVPRVEGDSSLSGRIESVKALILYGCFDN